MLSKQQKLRYGEILRQQMKQKQEKKKVQDMEKRGQMQRKNNQFQKPTQVQNQPQYFEKQNTNNRPFIDPKQQLIKKMQADDYNPFGRGGGGAPNKKISQQNGNNVTNMKNGSQPTNLYLNAQEMQQMNFQNSNRNDNSRIYTQEDVRRDYEYQQKYNAQNQNISPQTRNNYGDPYQKYPSSYQNQNNTNAPQNYPPSYNSIPQNGSYNQIPQNSYGGGYNSREEYVQSQIYRDRQNNYGSKNQLNYQQQQQLPPPQQQYGGYKNQQGYSAEEGYPMDSYKNYPQQSIKQNNNNNLPPQRTNTYENQQIQDVYKKGGRNLLKLENQTVDEHMVKQRQKQQIQKYLKLQIQEAERKKKQQKQRIKREELQQQRKQMMYIEQQKRKIQDQQKKKQDQKQKVINQNLKNLQKRKELQEQAKRKIQMENRNVQEKERMQRQRQNQQTFEQQRKKQSIEVSNEDRNQNHSRKFKVSEEDATSVIQSETSSMQKGFNTELSRQFFKKQRQKDPSKQLHDKKLQAFTQQIKKMRGQINNQGEMFQQQIIKVKMEAQKSQFQKRKAEQQIQRLKIQLKKKMDDDNEKLLKALQKTNNQSRPPPVQSRQRKPQRREQEYDQIVEEQNQFIAPPKQKPMRQKQNQKLVKKKFDVYHNDQNLQQSNNFQASGLMSLDGDSKKIPLYLENADKLTMSQVEDFAKQTHYFNKRQNNSKIPKSNNNQQHQQYKNNGFSQSIVQVDEQRDYQSRRSNRNRNSNDNYHNKNNNNDSKSRLNEQRDQLDKMVQSRQKSRGGWGQMSSVNSDITKQIEELLKKKDTNMNMNSNSNNRPNSISNAGKQSLARQGINYDGMSLHSINGGTMNSNNTLDIDRIYNRNQARLKQLKNLGVQTINTNNDDELDKLDQLLNKYK